MAAAEMEVLLPIESEQPTTPVQTLLSESKGSATPGTTEKGQSPQSSDGSPTATDGQSDSAQGESVCSSPGTQHLFDQISSELWKLAVAYILLRNTPNGERNMLNELLTLIQRKKAVANTSALLASSLSTNKGTPQRKPMPSYTGNVPLPPASSQGPFIRLITRGKTTLVHLGQLVGILDDKTGFLLQRVVSYDPTRAHLNILSQLTPADILHLTESKRQQIIQSEKRAKSGNLLSHLIATGDTLEKEKRVAEVPAQLHDLTTTHGPVLTTPGLVLIRAEQVCELAIISDNVAAEGALPPSEWCKELKQLHQQRQQQQQQQEQQQTQAGKTPASNKKEKPSTSATSSPDVNPQPTSEHQATDAATPIRRSKPSPKDTSNGKPKNTTVLKVIYDAVKNLSTEQFLEALSQMKTGEKPKRPYRRRGGRRQVETSEQNVDSKVSTQPLDSNQPNMATVTQTVQTTQQMSSSNQTEIDNGMNQRNMGQRGDGRSWQAPRGQRSIFGGQGGVRLRRPVYIQSYRGRRGNYRYH